MFLCLCMEKPRLHLLNAKRLKHNSHPYDALMMHRKKKETRLSEERIYLKSTTTGCLFEVTCTNKIISSEILDVVTLS